jgi:hypothetical protein
MVVAVVTLVGDVIETMDAVASRGSQNRNHRIVLHNSTRLLMALVPPKNADA